MVVFFEKKHSAKKMRFKKVLKKKGTEPNKERPPWKNENSHQKRV